MALTSGSASVKGAHDSGNIWTTYFNKQSGGASSAAGGQINDWSLTIGTPAFSAFLGSTELEFFPVSSPGITSPYIGPSPPAGKSRYLVGMQVRTTGNQGGNILELYDLLGYYPMIDGDAGNQLFDNSLTLPRYADGEGVMMSVSNSIAPPASGVSGVTINYVDHSGAAKTTPTFSFRGLANSAQQMGLNNSAFAGAMIPHVQLASGSRGVRSVTGINIPQVGAGGFYYLMLYKPLMRIGLNIDFNLPNERCNSCGNAWIYPQIYDGASLQFREMHVGSQSGPSIYHGQLDFIYG